MQKCMNPVAFFWGGPMMAVSDDNPWSYFERFAGGTTTAHGINRVFDDDSGIVRRIFWFCAFAGGCYGRLVLVAESCLVLCLTLPGAFRMRHMQMKSH